MYHNEKEKNISSLELINTPVLVNSEIFLERDALTYPPLFTRAQANNKTPGRQKSRPTKQGKRMKKLIRLDPKHLKQMLI